MIKHLCFQVVSIQICSHGLANEFQNLSEMVSCRECKSTDVDIEGNFCNECGEELQEEAEEERLIVVGVIREVFFVIFIF